jgi:hypothetical protein
LQLGLPAWLYQASVVHVEVVRPAKAACELVQSVADSPEAMQVSQEWALLSTDASLLRPRGTNVPGWSAYDPSLLGESFPCTGGVGRAAFALARLGCGCWYGGRCLTFVPFLGVSPYPTWDLSAPDLAALPSCRPGLLAPLRVMSFTFPVTAV